MVKGTAEKINMILFGRKEFLSTISNAMPQLCVSRLLPSPASSAASRKGTKSLVSGCCRMQRGTQAHPNGAHSQTPGPGHGGGRAA